ncbi:uncharacterized protein TM35_000081730 [Trypanosoma theileri]|uniref:Uncharacterized protein n=1 Tax=Trypanosoma theileri TaxID=67003 RepID=A0A1X0P0D2_9TRYP|nr:uncharacterized protein TM35_000081730 [Trypanosoma theileri]ORC90375.1 hypothetical protein TM35_000081730 [Trypanosoma theileri]
MTVKREDLLRRLRDKYLSMECPTQTTVNDNNNNNINRDWPLAVFSRREETPSVLDCPRCRQLLLELQYLEKEKRDDLSVIDLLTVTLAWERAHGPRRRQQQQQQGICELSMQNAITVTPSSSSDMMRNQFYKNDNRNGGDNEFGGYNNNNILVDMTPSRLKEAYLSLKEKQSIAEEEWFQQRCRYEREISDLKKQLAQVERYLNSKNELCELLQRECRIGNR